jgi:hypothetical protein
VGFLFWGQAKFFGTVFWTEYFGRFLRRKFLGTAVDSAVREEKMDVRGTSHDYFDEAARHASGDR